MSGIVGSGELNIRPLTRAEGKSTARLQADGLIRIRSRVP